MEKSMQKMTVAEAKETQGGIVFVAVALAFGAGYAVGSMLRRLL